MIARFEIRDSGNLFQQCGVVSGRRPFVQGSVAPRRVEMIQGDRFTYQKINTRLAIAECMSEDPEDALPQVAYTRRFLLFNCKQLVPLMGNERMKEVILLEVFNDGEKEPKRYVAGGDDVQLFIMNDSGSTIDKMSTSYECAPVDPEI